MRNIKRLLTVCCLFTVEARAEDIHLKNSRGKIPINSHSGTTIEFPRAIKEVDKSSHFQIAAIIKKIDEKMNTPVDIRSIHITPNSSRSKDHITVRLAGGRAIVLRIISTNGSDLNHRIHLKAKRKTKNAAEISKFLDPKIKLLKAMMADSQAHGFERIESSTSLDSKNNDFEFDLTRQYVGKETFGYVIEIENDTSKSQPLDPSWFSNFTDEKISIAHLNHEKLAPCSKKSDLVPCKTKLHLIVSAHQTIDQRRNTADLPFLLEAGR